MGQKQSFGRVFGADFSFPQNAPPATQAIILKASMSNLPVADSAIVVVGSNGQAFGQAHLWVRKYILVKESIKICYSIFLALIV